MVLAAFFAFMGLLAFVAAKYIKQTEKTSVANASAFYFTSDLLDGENHQIVPLADGTASVTLTLMNHADELRYSEVDIEYSVKVDAGDRGEAGNVELSAESASFDSNTKILTGTMRAGENHDATITISGLEAGKVYQVTASTSNTYAKTLTGTITVNKIVSQIYASVTDRNAFIEVTVWTGETAANNLKLTYCAGLIPDNTDSMMASAQSAAENESQEITMLSLEANTSHVFRFFKTELMKNYQAEISGTEVTVHAVS